MHPLWIAWAPSWLPPHALFETLAYALAGLAYRSARRADPVGVAGVGWLIALTTVAGAAIGARLLSLVQHLPVAAQVAPGSGGRSIVGGILGGWIAVEWVKRRLGVRARTGDAFVPALVAGIAIGRLGCFFSGTLDETHGLRSTLPWAMDLGDGIPRHPTALYEIGAVLLLGVLAGRIDRARSVRGLRFRVFVFGYLVWRLCIDFLKPGSPLVFGVTAIQFTALVASAMIAVDLVRLLRESPRSDHA